MGRIEVRLRRSPRAKPTRRPVGTGAGRKGQAARSRGTGRIKRKPAARRHGGSSPSRAPLALAAAFALVVVGVGFPFAGLLHQHEQLSAAAGELTQLRHQNQLLAEQQKQLSTSAEIKRLAQQNYQLVVPGAALYQILPPAGSTATPVTGQPSAGDPAYQPLVSPANAPNMTPDPGLPVAPAAAADGRSAGGSAAPTVGATSPARAPSSFWGRVVSTLEFWK